MGCRCSKCRKGEKKTYSEQETQTENDLEENIYDPNSMSRESDINNSIKINQELPSTENQTENNNELNNENEKIEEEIKKPMPYEIFLKDYLDEKIDGTDIFDKKWYSDIEKDKIIYSKRTIIALINEAFDEKNKDYKEIYNKPPLFISIKSNGSFITDQYQVTKNIYIINKNDLPKNTSIKMLSKYLLNIKERNSWDPQIKAYEIIEGSEGKIETKCILHNWMKSPMFLVSERDIVEKRYDFFYDGKFQTFESSVNDDYIPLIEKVTRINDIISIQQIIEENDNFVFRALTQMNAKVSLPQAIINTTLSGKLLDFYKGIIDAINKDYKDGKLVFEDNDGNIIDNNNNIEDIKINVNNQD